MRTLDSVGEELIAQSEPKIFSFHGANVLLAPSTGAVSSIRGTGFRWMEANSNIHRADFLEMGENGFGIVVSAGYAPSYYKEVHSDMRGWHRRIEPSRLDVNVRGINSRTFQDFDPSDPYIILLDELLRAAKENPLTVTSTVMERVKALGITAPAISRSGGGH